jgi:hypothetical protein
MGGASPPFTLQGATAFRISIAVFLLLGIALFSTSWRPAYLIQTEHPSGQRQTLQCVSMEENYGLPEHKQEVKPTPSAVPAASNNLCPGAPSSENIMLIMKTGSTELYQKLPIHFVTTFTCVHPGNLMIFSDLSQNISGLPVHDAIAPVSAEYRDNHEDFKIYRKLLEYQRDGQDMGDLEGDEGWTLDKWKFLPMLHMAFESAPDNIEWFVFIEADTSIAWSNLLLWLKTLDPREKYYMGSRAFISGKPFAHGGSGFVISRKAADLLEETRRKTNNVTEYDMRWENATSNYCCGDGVVALALKEAGVPITPVWPLIQGETVGSMDFTAGHWCSVAASWHHVTSLEVDAMWQFQMDWVSKHGWNTPFLHRDVFEHFVAPRISVNRTSWNNLSGDRRFATPDLETHNDDEFGTLQPHEKESIESADKCAAACLAEPPNKCVQWMWSPGRCHLGRDIRFGWVDGESEEGEEWQSGWMQDRIQAFKEKMGNCKPRWHGA